VVCSKPYYWQYYPAEKKWAHAEGYMVEKNTFNTFSIKIVNKATEYITIFLQAHSKSAI
jgi:hypothetical protein